MPSASEAYVQRIFEEERARFMAAFPRMPDVRLAVRDRHYRVRGVDARDLAWYDIGGRTVYILRSAFSRSDGAIRGILRHELGHAADVDVGKKGSEARADRLALLATGVPVRYTADGVQHATHGQPGRPGWLHR